ncbi:hypothetical protein Q7P37_007157 [Cladosporium fusiforme]
MKSFSLALIFGAIAATQAQSVEDLPACSRGCAYESIGRVTDCNPSDFGCLCAGDNLRNIQNDGVDCVLAYCGVGTAFNEVVPAMNRLCGQ